MYVRVYRERKRLTTYNNYFNYLSLMNMSYGYSDIQAGMIKLCYEYRLAAYGQVHGSSAGRCRNFFTLLKLETLKLIKAN